MAITYVAIATTTVGAGGASSIDFTSIPGTYTDLVVKLSVRGDNNVTTQQMYMTFNNSTTGYSARQVYGDGASATSATLSNSGAAISIVNTNTSVSTANTFSSTDVYIPNYTSSNNKSASADSVTENNGTTALAGLTAGLWSNTAAITSVKFAPQSGNFVQYSTATLYGIKNTV
jgi:hypothetical protein